MLTPRPYQRAAIQAATTHNLLLGDECGLGKSLVAIEAVREIRERLQYGPALVICKKAARRQWAEMITEQLPTDTILVLETAGRVPPNADDPRNYDWIITHYEGMVGAAQWLMKIQWLVIIADECHYIKNRKAKRTIWINQLKATRKIGLSATPMDKYPHELWAPMHWLDPKRFTSYWAWYESYCDVKENWLGYKEVVGVKNHKQLAEVLSQYMLRRTKIEVAPDLPPKIVQFIGVDMEGQQSEFYERIRKSKDIIVDVSEFRLDDDGKLTGPSEMIIKNTLAQIVRLQQISSDPLLLDVKAPSAKLEWLKEYLYDNPEEVMVLFTRFRDTAIRLASEYDAALIVGGIANPVDRAAPFLTGRKRLLVGTIAAMGESLNLQRAGTAVFVDQEWSSLKMQQAEDRIHRMNIDSPKNIIYLASRNSVDLLILKALREKWNQTELVYYYLRQEGGVYED